MNIKKFINNRIHIKSMKNTFLLVLGIFFFSFLVIPSISAITFNSTILDSSEKVYTSPALKIDSTGINHLVYSKQNELIYMTSFDKYLERKVISNDSSFYTNPVIDIDTNEVAHISFIAYKDGKWRQYYVNSNDWIIKELDIGNGQEVISIKTDSKNKVYITGQKEIGDGEEMNIILASSTDYENFDYQTIHKSGHQLNPVIDIDSLDNIHLIYWDWSDGVKDGAGLYKTRYRNSIDGFTDEETISDADQSYGADIKIDKSDNIWVAFKDSDKSYPDMPFDSGTIYLANRSSKWAKQQIQDVTTYIQERPLSLSISDDGIKHVSWSEMNWTPGEEFPKDKVLVMYGVVNSPVVVTLQDVGFLPDLGFVSIDTYDNKPYLVANIHSLVDYSLLQETPTIDDLLKEINDLKQNITQINERVTLLETLVDKIREFIEATKIFPLFKEFWIWQESPKQCFVSDKQCVNNVSYSCSNYTWQVNQSCQWGCGANNQCASQPNENCLLKPSTFSCRYTYYSVEKDYNSCKSGYGNATSCKPGYCTHNSKWTRCSNGCNVDTGLCKD